MASCHQTPNGQSSRRIWPFGSVLLQYPALRYWIHTNGNIVQRPSLCCSSNLLFCWKHRFADPPQIFIADTINLLNRALWSSMPDTPFLITVWIGSIIGSAIYKNTTWRWGSGIWCIILPAAFLPLALTLFLNNSKAKNLGLTAPSQWRGLGIAQMLKKLWSEIDIGGIVLLSAVRIDFDSAHECGKSFRWMEEREHHRNARYRIFVSRHPPFLGIKHQACTTTSHSALSSQVSDFLCRLWSRVLLFQ
jgi:hypothetical protein